jgi:hypothetical protein
VRIPGGWEALRVGPAAPGLALRDGVAAAPQGRESLGVVVAGLAARNADNPALLGTDLLRALGVRTPATPPRDTVRLRESGLQAYYYEDLRPRGVPGSVSAYAVPTTAGVVTVACLAPVAGPAGLRAGCRRIADSLRVRGAKAFPLGPNGTLARTIDESFSTLGVRLRAPRAQPGGPVAARRARRRAAGCARRL